MDVLISAKRLLWKPKQRQGSKAAMAMTTGTANIRKTLEGGANMPVCRRKRDGRYFPAQACYQQTWDLPAKEVREF